MQEKAYRPKLNSYLFKLGISGGLLYLIMRTVNPGEALASLTLVPPGILALALALQLASTAVASFRWYLIMQRIGSEQPFSFFLKSYFKGTFFNQGLPTSIGGDGVRILDYATTSGSTVDGFSGVFIDRFAGLAGLLILNICALVLSGDILPPGIRYLLFTVLVLLLFFLVALFYLRRVRLFKGNRLLGVIGQLSDRYYRVYADPPSLAMQLGLSVLIHLCAMTAIYLLGLGVGLDYSLAVYLVLVPPVILLTLLPVSLAGWGIREGAMIGFFLLVGAERSRVLSFSVLYGIIVLVHSLPGLFVFLTRRNKVY
jgi:hypothetical protein